MKNFFKSYHYIFVSFFLVLLVFLAGFHSGSERSLSADVSGAISSRSVSVLSDSGEEVDLTPFWKAWNTLNEKHYKLSTKEEVTSTERLWGAISGMVNSLGDPYTVFLPPADNEIFEGDINGNFEGVGMEIGIKNDILTVVAPLKDTPAYKAGILSGDRIIEIDKKQTYDMTVMEAVKHIRGKKGTEVELTVQRDGEEGLINIKVIRGVIEIPTLETELLENGIFVIRLYNFSATAPNLFRLALIDLVKSGSDKVILDLRGNPGGFLDGSIDIASRFLPIGKIVVKENFGEKRGSNVYRSKGYNVFGDRDLVILVNKGSASASEILAGALQEHGIAKVVGTKTFGKGSVQEVIKITSDTSLKVTVAEWLTPSGKSISDGGLTPDYEVEITEEDREANRDSQMEKAIQLLLEK